MARFIPIDKMKKLREASHNGDERAKKILAMQLGGKDDFSSLMDEYFAPQVEEKPNIPENGLGEQEDKGLNDFLSFNGIDKNSPDYQSYVDDYYKENPKQDGPECHECECKELLKKLIKEELDAIDSYNKAIMEIMNSEELNENQKRKIISRLKEIRGDEEEHFKELNDLIPICDNKEIEGTID